MRSSYRRQDDNCRSFKRKLNHMDVANRKHLQRMDFVIEVVRRLKMGFVYFLGTTLLKERR
jgi:hypothetical protein